MAGHTNQLHLLPERMRGDVARYIGEGILPGQFLTAVLLNDLRSACERADDENRHLLFDYVKFFYNYAPGSCWGSPDCVNAWVAKGGLAGRGAAS